MQSRTVIFAEMGKPLLVEQVDYDDEVAPGHALVRNFASGVCHSQLHALHGHTNPTFPTVLGHESTGEVVAVGDGVDHIVPGDKVLVGWLPRNPQPGTGRTVSTAPVRWKGEDLNGHAGIYTWSEHTVCNAEFVLKVPDDTPNEVTSIIGCAVMTGSGAVTNSLNVQKGESCAVYGVGGVGLCAIAAAAVRDADPIIAVDLSDEKLEFAKHFGANVLINAREVDPVEEIIRITDGGADYAIDAIGAPETTGQIIDSVRPSQWDGRRGGVAAIIGSGIGRQEIPTRSMLQGERTLIGTLGGSCVPEKDFPEFLRWYNEGQLDLDALVTERHPIEGINEAVGRLERGEVFGRSILTF